MHCLADLAAGNWWHCFADLIPALALVPAAVGGAWWWVRSWWSP